jgi:3',5'-cyclic AMP phosphodiesterase CpdA
MLMQLSQHLTFQRCCLPLALLAFVALGISCRTAPEASSSQAPMLRPVRVALVSDTHVTRGAKESQPFHRVRFNKAIAEVNSVKPDLVLIAGDLTENGTVDEYRDFKQQIRQFTAPVWYVPGNHDVGGKNIPGKKPGTFRSRMQACERALGPSWWVREQGGLRVAGANGPLFGSGFPEEKRMWEELETALALPVKTPTLFMLHYPPFQKTNNEPGGVYWNLEPYPRARLLALLKQGGVKTVLSGHLHQNLTNHFEGITLLTTTSVVHGDPLKKAQFGWMLLTVAANGAVKIEPQPLKFDAPPYLLPPANKVAAQ